MDIIDDIVDVFDPIGDAVKGIIPDIIIDFFRIIMFLITTVIDFILGGIAFGYTLAEELVKLLPLIFDYLDMVLDYIVFLLELAEDYTVIPVVIITLIPFYIMTYLLINRLNNLLG